MATVSKLIAALLQMEKDSDDLRKVVVKTEDTMQVFKIKRITEGTWEGKSKVILWVEEI